MVYIQQRQHDLQLRNESSPGLSLGSCLNATSDSLPKYKSLLVWFSGEATQAVKLAG